MANNTKGREVKKVLSDKFENSKSLEHLQHEAWDTIHQAVGMYFIEQEDECKFIENFQDRESAARAVKEAKHKKEIAFNSVIKINPN